MHVQPGDKLVKVGSSVVPDFASLGKVMGKECAVDKRVNFSFTRAGTPIELTLLIADLSTKR